ncbi:FkbM family methyltransferase [Flavitalea flava]
MDSIFRKLPLFRGKTRLAKFFLNNSLAHKKDVWVKGKYGCEYLLPNLLENISFDIFVNGIYEEATSGFFVNRLPEGGVFLDLGANIGTISIPLRRQRKDVRIVCVEAAPWLFGYLQRNLSQNGFGDVHAVNKALYYKDNEELNFYSPDEKFGKGSLSPVFTKEGVKVITITVDTLVKELNLHKVDIIKIDVEGYEYQVFKGAEELLKREDAPDILFEFADWAEELAGLSKGSAQSLLKEWGYSLSIFDDDGRMRPIPGILSEGNVMIYATKKG